MGNLLDGLLSAKVSRVSTDRYIAFADSRLDSWHARISRLPKTHGHFVQLQPAAKILPAQGPKQRPCGHHPRSTQTPAVGIGRIPRLRPPADQWDHVISIP